MENTRDGGGRASGGRGSSQRARRTLRLAEEEKRRVFTMKGMKDLKVGEEGGR